MVRARKWKHHSMMDLKLLLKNITPVPSRAGHDIQEQGHESPSQIATSSRPVSNIEVDLEPTSEDVDSTTSEPISSQIPSWCTSKELLDEWINQKVVR